MASKISAPVIVFALSVFLNILSAAFLILALNSRTSAVAFHEPPASSFTAAAVASVPLDAGVVFNAVEITLKKGGQAFLQFSTVIDRRQSNFLAAALYDHSIVSISPSGFGITINALSEGEAVIQVLTNDGIMDIARVKVL